MTDTNRHPIGPLRLRAILKLCFTVTVVLVACSLSWEAWPATGALTAIVLAALACARIRLAVLLRRLTLFLPIMTLVAISVSYTHLTLPTKA